ncbi:hypothetical protein FF32_02370 [Halomonas campaniensis]|nr:hypothetical protein FF32_02370 [Halomonas campaniensis]
MNNVFRLIWNRTLGRLVVASEAARSQHKAGNGSKQVGQSPIPVRKTTECQLFTPLKPKALLLACATMLLLPLGISDAEARKFASDGGSCVSGGGGVAIGRLITTNTNADPVDGSGTYSTVAGCNASGNNQSAATVYGTFSQVTGAGGAAFGFNVRAARWATAIGLESRATGVSGTALGFGSQATARNAVAIGGAGGDGTTPLAVADSTIASGINSIAIGSNNVRGAQALGSNAIAIGGEATASQLSSTALGNKSQATGATSLAIGERSEAKAEFANALGVQSKAEGLASLAVGPAAKALAESSVAMGRRSEATELQSIAVGLDSKASGVDSLAIGTGAIASGDKTISIGFANEVSGTGSGAIGDPNIITGAGSYALGNDNTIDADEAGAFGNRNILAATADGSRIIGNDNNIDVSDAMVVGNNADVTQAGGVALGSGSVADTGAGIQGYNPTTSAADGLNTVIAATESTTGAVAVGDADSGVFRQITGVAAGSEDSDAVNVAQLKASETHYFSVNDDNNPQGNYANDGATGANALAAGVNAEAIGDGDVAIGEGARVDGSTLGGSSVAVGQLAEVDGAADAAALGSGAKVSSGSDGGTAIGSEATVGTDSRNAISIGRLTSVGSNAWDSVALGSAASVGEGASGAVSIGILASNADGAFNSIALGSSANNSESGSVSIGSEASTTAGGAVAIGGSATATAANGVALGSESEADTAAGIAGYVPFGATAADTSAITGTEAQRAAVDVGSRQITSVAAGTELDDAVNVSQLIAAQSKVEAGTNTEVIETENSDGGTIYTVNADSASVSAGSGAVDVNAAAPDANNVTDYAVDLSQASKDSLTLADSALQDVVTQVDGVDVKTLTKGDNNANFVTGKNMVLSPDGAGGIEIATLDNVTFTDVQTDTLTAGPVNIGAAGIDAGNTTISGVAPGVAGTDAVNLNQLDDAAAASKTEVAGGTNIASVDKATGINGQDIYTVNADGASVSAGSGALDVTAAAPDANNVTDYAVDLSQASKDSLTLADSALQTVVTQIDGTAVKTIDQNDNVANFVTGDNIVLSDEAGGIKIATADDVTFTSINSDSLAITGGPTLTGGGIDMNATTISNLADGVNANDAVNLSQLEGAAAASKTEVVAGTNVTSVDQATGADGQAIYTVNADSASVSAGSGAVDVTAAAPDANNFTDYAVDLSQASKDSLTLADSALQDVVTQVDGVDVKTLTKGDNNANFVTGKNMVLSPDGAGGIEIATLDNVTFTDVQASTLTAGPVNIGATGIDAGNTTISGVAPGVAGTDAVNLNQLDDAAAASKTEVAGGTNIASVDKATGINGQDIYTVNADGASVRAGSGAVDVTAAAPDANNVTDYAVDLSQASKDSLTLADSALQAVVTQINGVEVKTLDQNDNVANFIEGKNVELTDIGGSIEVATADDVTFTSINSDSLAITGGPTLTGSGIDMNATTISNLADGVNANDAVNLSQLEGAAAASKTEVIAGTNVTSVDQATGADGQAIYTVNADSASVSAGSGAVDVTAAAPDASNVTDYAVDLSQASKDSLILADSALQDVVTQVDGVDVKTLTKGDNNANFVTGKNMVLSPDGAGGIEIATLDNVTFTDVQTSTLTAGPVNIGATGIDAGNTTISGVAPGVAGTDAVNLNQLDDAAAASKTEVAGGTNIASVDKATGINGQDIYTVNADGASVSAGSGAVDVTAAAPDANNVTDYAVDLSQASKDSLTLADSALQDVVTQVDGVDVKTLTKGDNNANFVTGKNMVLSPDGAGGIEIATLDNVTFTDVQTDTLTAGPVNIGATGIDAGNTTISGVAPGVAGTDAVNLNQLDDAAAASKTEVAGGTNVASVDKATGVNGQDIYTINADGSSVSAGTGVDVVAAAPDANNVTDYEVALNQDTQDSLLLADSALQTVVTQIDGTEVKTLDENDNVANFVTGDNIVLSDEAGGIKIATADDVTFTSINSDSLAITGGPTLTGGGIDMSNTTISNLADGVNANDAVNLSQLEGAAAASKTEVAGGTNIASVDKATGINGQDIYTVNADGASVSAGSGAVDVTAAAPDASNVTDYAVDLSQASKDSLLLADSALQTVVTQIDGTEVKTLDENDNVANFVTGDNIVLSDEAGSIKIATADDVTFTSINSDSLAITGGPTLTGGGIDMNGGTISDLAPGVNPQDAVNLSQLENSAAASKTEVVAGTNVTSVDQATGADGQAIYTVNADSASVSAGSGAVDVTAAAPDANNVTDYAVDLSQASKDSLTLADSALQTVVTQIDGTAVKTIDQNDNVANFVTGDNIVLSDDAGGIKIATADDVTFTSINSDSLVITGGPTLTGGGIDMNGGTISDLAPGVNPQDAVNLSQLESSAAASKTEVAGGTNIASVDKATGINGQDIYTVNADGASVSAGSGALDVTAAAPDANNVTDYAVDLSQASKDSLTLADSALQTVVTQIDGTAVKKIDQNDNVANFVTGDNIVLSDEAGGIKIATADDVTFTSINSDSLAITGGPALTGGGIDMNATTISNLADGVNANDAVNLSQLEGAAAASKTEVVAGTNVTSVDQATGADGQAIYTVNADSASVSAGSGAVDVTAAAPDANNVTDYAVDLSQASKDSLTLADSALQTVVTQIDGVDVKTLDQNDNTANFVTGDNIVLSDEAGGIKIATADDVTFTSINSDSLAITGGPTLTGGGIDMSNTTISNLADGVNANDAVNLSQLENSAAASKTEVAGGTNVANVDKATGINGQDIYTVNADGASVSAGSGAVDVTAAAPDASNVTDYAVDLSQASKDSLILADSALQDVVTQVDGVDVKTLTKGDNNANFVTGKNMVLSPDGAGGIEIATLDNVTFTDVQTSTLTAGPVNIGATGIDAGNTTISGVAPGVAGTDAVNLNQLDDAAAASKTEVAGGTNIASVDKATGINGQDIYTVNADGASVSAGSGAVDVTAAAPDASNVTDYAVDLSQASKDSLILADSALQTVVTQIDGTVVKTIDQNDNVANFVTGDNIVLSDEAGGIKIATADDVTFTSINSDSLAITGGPTLTGGGIDMNGGTISDLAPGINPQDAVNLSQLENSAAASKLKWLVAPMWPVWTRPPA